jgi:hypothetical protein
MNYSEAFAELISNAFLPPLLLERKSKDTVATFTSILKECIPLKVNLGLDLRYPGSACKDFLKNLDRTLNNA